MSDLAHLKIWDDPAIRDSLSWYLDVAENRRPAKFRIAATVATQIDPVASSEDALWVELDRLTPIFLERWQAIRAGAPLPATADGPTLLEVCRELAYRVLTHCNFCPWNCRVDPDGGREVRRRLGMVRRSFAQYSPAMLLAHFIGDACSREPDELGERRVRSARPA